MRTIPQLPDRTAFDRLMYTVDFSNQLAEGDYITKAVVQAQSPELLVDAITATLTSVQFRISGGRSGILSEIVVGIETVSTGRTSETTSIRTVGGNLPSPTPV